MAEATRLSNLAPGEWKLWLQRSAEQLGIRPEQLADLVEAQLAAKEQLAREKAAEEKRIVARAEAARKGEALQLRKQLSEDAAKAKKAKGKAKGFEDILKLPADLQETKVAALATTLGEDAEAVAAEFVDYRAAETKTEAAGLLPLWDVEPSGEAVTTAEVLEDLIACINAHLKAKPHQVLSVALWVMFAWAHEIAHFSPYLLATAPDSECGKTTLMRIVGRLAPRPYLVGNASPASVYHIVDREHPTVVIDNIDRTFKAKPELTDLFLFGFTRGFPVPRVVKHVVYRYEVFGPKACSLIGTDLPEALLSRCLIIDLWPMKPGESVDDLDDLELDPEQAAKFDMLRRKLARWANDNMAALKGAKPSIPVGFVNRSVDIWILQWAIADLAGDEWGKLARDAAELLFATEIVEPSWMKRLLTELWAVFVDENRPWITSGELVKRLTNDPASPWNNYRGGRVSQWHIPKLLRPLTIKSCLVGKARVGGYRPQEFFEKEIFARFLGRDSLPLSPDDAGADIAKAKKKSNKKKKPSRRPRKAR
ncbi:hypothetical protein XH97_18170 [Bradyrhizobium sp. CCBAU 53380]|nr:hypothetical protein [Bradyrhizobium sp. CCBAU 53380]